MAGGSPFAFAGAVVGGAVGSFGGPAGIYKGAQIGATVGTVAGAIFGKPQDANKSRDTRWGGTTYGTSIPRGWGRHRTDAPVFWGVRNKDGSYLFKHTEKKRKKSGSTKVAHYHATFAFLILETGLTYADDGQTQVERRIVVDRVWMADKVVWQSASAVPIADWASGQTYDFGDHVSDGGKVYASVGDRNVGHEPGHSGSGNWWTVASTTKNYALEFHPDDDESTFTQAASSIMVSHDGIANTPAYRGLTYGIANDVDLYDLGNALPNNVSVEWHWADDCRLRDLLDDSCGLGGMPVGSYDFSDVPDLLTGYRQTARQAGQDLLGSPLSIKGYDLVSIDGVVRAVRRGGAITATIDPGELGATLDGSPIGLLDESVLADDTELHSSLRLGFFDASAGFRQSYELACRNTHPTDNPTDIPSDLVMTIAEAAQAAGYLLDAEWLERGGTIGLSLTGDRSAIVGGDPVLVPVGGALRRYRVTGTEFVQNSLKAKVVRDDPEILNRHETGTAPLASVPDDGQIRPTALVVMSPATDLSNDLAEYPGFYAFVNGPDGWLGAQIVYTFDPPDAEDREWVTADFVADASVFGTMTSVLPDVGAPPPSVPPAPTGLAAMPGDTDAGLNWSTASGATGYSLKRSTVSGGPYTTVQTGLTTPSFTDTGLVNGTTYRYVVSATNAAGESPNSLEASVTPVAPGAAPAAPTNLTATGGTSRVSLAWNASSGAGSYALRRGTTGGSYPDTVASGLTSTTYADTGRTNGATYHYAVVATNAVGSSAPSSDASATPIAPPTGLVATAGNGSVALSWNASAGASGYLVEYGTTSGGPYGSMQVASGTSATVSGLTNGTSYDFVVVGTNSVGQSDPSSEASATPMAPVSPPSPPTGLACHVGSGQLGLTWNAASGAGSYTLLRGASAGSHPTVVASGLTGLSYTDGPLTNGTAYWYVVRAVGASGTSGDSNEASGTPTSTPNPQVPQGGTGAFPPTGTDSPSGGPPGWEVRDPSGTQVASSGSPRGWTVSYSAADDELVVSAPTSAPVAAGYEALWFYTSTSPVRPRSAPFDVIAAGRTPIQGPYQQPVSGD